MTGKQGRSPESIVREIKRQTRRKFPAEEKIRIVLEGLLGRPVLATSAQVRGTMKVIAFMTEYAVVDRIIDHLNLTFYKGRSRRVIDIAVRRRYITIQGGD